jgi:hypothetical protein
MINKKIQKSKQKTIKFLYFRIIAFAPEKIDLSP